MCGRFVRAVSLEDIADEFGVDKPDIDLSPSHNIAPSQNIAIIKNEEKRSLAISKWGLVPSWAKDPAIGHKMINARSESIAEKPSFKSSFKHHRILIPANGFYEWKREGKIKSPYYIRLKSRSCYGFAGLVSYWKSPEGEQICTSCIITTSANDLIKPIHDRMPVIIRKKDEDLWLDGEEQDKNALLALLKPYSSDEMDYYAVSTMVNSPANNSPECIKPVHN
jgi:putative SOS response-associated peptidase YedK